MTATTRRPTTPDAPDWRASAACATVDAELFFPTAHTNGWRKQTRDAKAVCATCPVREQCLQWALTTGQAAGVWGGKDETERRLIKRGTPLESVTLGTYRNRAPKESRYWPHYPNAVEGILATRRREVEVLVRQDAPVGRIALALQTNAQTVKKVLARLAAETEGAAV